MKRTKLMAGTLILATALLGTGYAAWTDVLKVNATVSTGTLDVQFANPEAEGTITSDEWLNETDLTRENGDKGLDDPQVFDQAEGIDATIENDLLVFDYSNIHPNSNVAFSVDLVNKGSVPAVLDTVTVEGNAAAEILLKITSGDEISRGSADAIAKVLKRALDGVVLEPNESKTLTFTFSLDEKLGNATQNQSTGKMKLKLNWAQEDTAPVTPVTPPTTSGN